MASTETMQTKKKKTFLFVWIILEVSKQTNYISIKQNFDTYLMVRFGKAAGRSLFTNAENKKQKIPYSPAQ